MAEEELVSLQKCVDGLESDSSDDQVAPVRHWKLGQVLRAAAANACWDDAM